MWFIFYIEEMFKYLCLILIIKVSFNELSFVITVSAPIEHDEIIWRNLLLVSTNRNLLDSLVRMIFVRVVRMFVVSIIASSLIKIAHHGYDKKKIKSIYDEHLKKHF